MRNRIFFYISALLLLLTVSGCLTKKLWGYSNYRESIKQFLVGSDGRYIVLVGTNYHYVFADNSMALSRILSLRQRGVLNINPEKTNLKLDDRDYIEGVLVIEGFAPSLAPEDSMALRSLGFAPDADNYISIPLRVSGRRYAPRNLGGSIASSTEYIISINYDGSSAAEKVGKAAITPITVTLDAALLIGKVVLKPLAVIGGD